MDEQQKMELFFELHSNNPREGPGSPASTQKAFKLLASLPSKPDILDIGCGPGMQTIDLCRLTNGTVTAIDNHPLFLEQLKTKAKEEGFENKVTVSRGDMSDLKFPERSFDLLWAEGSIYFMGFENGLRQLRRLVKKGGYAAVSELTRLKSGVPEEGRAFWEGEYPAMQDIQGNISAIERAGYKPIGHFPLPESDWWNYYNPIIKRLAMLKGKYRNNAEALEVLANDEKEIDMYRKYSEYYGYAFYAARSET